MFDKSLSFVEVQRILLAIGFRRGTVSAEDAGTPVAQTVFVHDRTDTLFAFPATTVTVDPARIESIRRILVGRGVTAEDVIGEMLAAGARTTVA